jgi:hypothetical protein
MTTLEIYSASVHEYVSAACQSRLIYSQTEAMSGLVRLLASAMEVLLEIIHQ